MVLSYYNERKVIQQETRLSRTKSRKPTDTGLKYPSEE